MNFTEIATRLTGFSCPLFGVSWNPPDAERTIAREIITFLEDRRVLYVPSEMEVPEHCAQSVLRIREFLTAQIGGIEAKSQLSTSLRAMRAACRKFLNTTVEDGGIILSHGGRWGHFASWKFAGALGELRGAFGIHVAQIAAQNGLDVEDDLASILPGPEGDV